MPCWDDDTKQLWLITTMPATMRCTDEMYQQRNDEPDGKKQSSTSTSPTPVGCLGNH